MLSDAGGCALKIVGEVTKKALIEKPGLTVHGAVVSRKLSKENLIYRLNFQKLFVNLHCDINGELNI